MRFWVKGVFMEFEDAQNDMNFSYFGGGTGVLISGLVYCRYNCSDVFKPI
jgi:hypothetical protein